MFSVLLLEKTVDNFSTFLKKLKYLRCDFAEEILKRFLYTQNMSFSYKKIVMGLKFCMGAPESNSDENLVKMDKKKCEEKQAHTGNRTQTISSLTVIFKFLRHPHKLVQNDSHKNLSIFLLPFRTINFPGNQSLETCFFPTIDDNEFLKRQKFLLQSYHFYFFGIFCLLIIYWHFKTRKFY
jgi:hypothetical protein